MNPRDQLRCQAAKCPPKAKKLSWIPDTAHLQQLFPKSAQHRFRLRFAERRRKRRARPSIRRRQGPPVDLAVRCKWKPGSETNATGIIYSGSLAAKKLTHSKMLISLSVEAAFGTQVSDERLSIPPLRLRSRAPERNQGGRATRLQSPRVLCDGREFSVGDRPGTGAGSKLHRDGGGRYGR